MVNPTNNGEAAAPALVDLHTVEHNAQFSAPSPIDGLALRKIGHTLDALLVAACGMQRNRRFGEEDDMLMTSLGKYMQHLRNQLAEELEPVFNAFGVEGPDY